MTQAFERILFVMFENQYRSYVIQHPFMRKLASAGAELKNSFGAFHPSQTNYLASLTGEVCGVTNDTPPANPLPQKTLVDLFEEKNISWKAYMEAYPESPWNPLWESSNYPPSEQPINESPNNSAELARYFRKHNAFASCHSIQKDKARWNKIVSENTFWQDLQNKGKTLPRYSWFTPDIWNDGHYLYNTHTSTTPRTLLVSQMAGWLENVFLGNIAASKVQGASSAGVENIGLNLDIDKLLTDPETAWQESRVPKGTLIVITFDEADYDAKSFDTNYDGPNQIYTVLLGDMIPPNTTIDTPLNHYSFIKTVERNFSLDHLDKNDRDANYIRDLWQEKFCWEAPIASDITLAGTMAATHLNGDTHLIFEQSEGLLATSKLYGNQWSSPKNTNLTTTGLVATCSLNNTLHVVFSGIHGQLYYSCSDCGEVWTQPLALNAHGHTSIALSTYLDMASNEHKLMLCFTRDNGAIEYLSIDQASLKTQSFVTAEPQSVGQFTDGPMATSQLGGSVYLVYKERNTRHMRMTSFNTAPFNAFKAVDFNNAPAPENDTSLHQWSPFDVHVGHFSKKMGALQNNYQCLGNMTLTAIEGEMYIVNRAGYADTPEAYSASFGLTGIFTASHQLSNGFGTIHQAGWTTEKIIPAVNLTPTSPLSLASNGQTMTLIWQDASSQKMMFCNGGYSRER